MARRVRASTLENRTARLKLEPRRKPYHFTIIAPGLAVGYRRNKGPGTWVLRAADGHGAFCRRYRTRRRSRARRRLDRPARFGKPRTKPASWSAARMPEVIARTP